VAYRVSLCLGGGQQGAFNVPPLRGQQTGKKNSWYIYIATCIVDTYLTLYCGRAGTVVGLVTVGAQGKPSDRWEAHPLVHGIGR